MAEAGEAEDPGMRDETIWTPIMIKILQQVRSHSSLQLTHIGLNKKSGIYLKKQKKMAAVLK